MKKRFQYSNNHNLRVFLRDTPNTVSMCISYNNIFSFQITAHPQLLQKTFLKTPFHNHKAKQTASYSLQKW